MGWLYLDTGAMYRAVGLAFQTEGLPFTGESAAHLMPTVSVDLRPADDGLHVFLNQDDVTDQIRTPEASTSASQVALLADVRTKLVEAQRRIARREVEAGRGVVMEGRDIGTVVFPDADVKFFMIADLSARARRRYAELSQQYDSPSFQAVMDDLEQRDRRDAERSLSPLRPAEDAIVLDTTSLSVEEQVDAVLARIHELQ